MSNESFYHFTDTRNLPSIQQHGLLSPRQLRQKNISVVTGGNEWSRDSSEAAGLDDYVHLALTDDHPMEYIARKEGRIQQTRYLRIHPDVLKIVGAVFTNGVANKRGISRLTIVEACAELDLQVLYSRTDWKDPAIQLRRKTAKKYELLIPQSVPPNMILK